MNPLYVQTFRRHRRLFVGIVIVAVASALWMNLGAPKMYRSALTLKAVVAGPEQVGSTPAQDEQTMLTELLATQHFRSAVARRAAPLRAYFESHSGAGWGPGALIASVRGGGAVDARIDSALSPKHVTSAVLGPHFLLIAYEAPSPAVARKTLQVIVGEYMVEREALVSEALDKLRQELRSASAELTSARSAAALRAAKQRRSDARKALQTASDPASQAIVSVEDKATLPAVPTAGKKKLVKSMLAGLFAGLLISGLGIVALTKGPQLVRASDAADPDLDFERMSDAELARLLQDMEVEEEWPTASNGQHDELSERRRAPSD